MTQWRELAVIAILSLFTGAQAWAQYDEQIPPPPLEAEASMETAPSMPHMTSYGFLIPPGWNIGMAADALGVYDSNPAFLLQPSGDVAQRYSGDISLTYLSKHTIYQANYLPSFTYYGQFTDLNNGEQKLSQSLWHDASMRTGFGWRFDAGKYPSWGGSAFSNSSFGSLLMELSGLTGLDLMSNVSTATTGFSVDHKLNQRSHLHADVSGGVNKYVHCDSNQLVSLLTAPDSSTWSGVMSLTYSYQLNSHRTLGTSVSSSYNLFTAQSYHVMTQSAVIRYEEKLRDGWVYSVAAGPEFREEQQSSGSVQPGLNLNVDLVHKTRRTSFRASVVSSYQMGQAQNNLTSWVALLSLEHAIGKHCFAGVFGNYQRSESLVAAGSIGTGSTQTVAPAVDGGVRLGRHVVWFANYGFSAQKGALTRQKTIYRQQLVSGLSFNVDSLFPR